MKHPTLPVRMAVVLVLAVVALGSPARAMIRTLTLMELVRQADVIVSGTVEYISEEGAGRKVGGVDVIELRNIVVPADVLKGTWLKDAPVILHTIKPRKGWIEDNVEIPPAKTRVLLFLTRTPDGQWAPTNGIQGVWPIQDGAFRAMGTGKTLADVLKAVTRDHAAAVFQHGLDLHRRGDVRGAVARYKESLREVPDATAQWQVADLDAALASGQTTFFATDLMPCQPADPEGVAVPGDFSIRWGSGPAHADWGGGSSTTINAAGQMMERQDAPPGRPGTKPPAPVLVKTLSAQAMRRIYGQVVACGFFQLERSYQDYRVMDGGVSFISVTAEGKTHEVSMANTSVSRVTGIRSVIDSEAQLRR